MRNIVISLAAAMTLTFAHASSAADTTAASFNPAQQKQIEKVVHDYLIKNPEVIVEAIQVLQQKQMDQARQNIKKTEESVPKFADALFHQTNDPMAGNPNGQVTLVDFFDYQCPHCTKMTPILESILASNPNVRIVFKEFPIRGPVSEYASKMALAAKNQGKYFEFYKALMEVSAKEQPLTEDSINKVAKSVGLNMDKAKADVKSDAVNQQIKANTKLAQDLLLVGTPAFFVAKTKVTKSAAPTEIAFIPGQVDQAQLLAVIKKIGQ